MRYRRPRQRASRRVRYFWIVTELDGQPYLISGGRTEEEARAKGLEQLAGRPFRIKMFPTTSQPRASAMLRGHTLEDSKDLRKASRRQGHSKSLLRYRRKHG